MLAPSLRLQSRGLEVTGAMEPPQSSYAGGEVGWEAPCAIPIRPQSSAVIHELNSLASIHAPKLAEGVSGKVIHFFHSLAQCTSSWAVLGTQPCSSLLPCWPALEPIVTRLLWQQGQAGRGGDTECSLAHSPISSSYNSAPGPQEPGLPPSLLGSFSNWLN